MRNLAKLTLFFSLTFIIIFASVTCLKFLSLQVNWAKSLPPKPETALTLLLAAAHWALSLTLFSSILLTLNYIVRRKHFPLISIIMVMSLAFGFCFGISFVLNQMKLVPPAQTEGIQLGGKGLILSNAMNRNVTAVILLDGTENLYGPRVTAIPGQPLFYQDGNLRQSRMGEVEVQPAFNRIQTDLPSFPFGDDTPWFLKSLSIDIRLNAEVLFKIFTEGLIPYLIYTGSLIFLLCSLGFAMKFSVWPLANLFIAALAFRGILAFLTFFNSPDIQVTISSFLNNIIPVALALPIFFIGFGILINFYSLLAFIARRRDKDDD